MKRTITAAERATLEELRREADAHAAGLLQLEHRAAEILGLTFDERDQRPGVIKGGYKVDHIVDYLHNGQSLSATLGKLGVCTERKPRP